MDIVPSTVELCLSPSLGTVAVSQGVSRLQRLRVLSLFAAWRQQNGLLPVF